MATYLMSDIHGYETSFFNMLNKINFSKDDILYILGDVIDRGPYGIQLLKYIFKQENIHLLMGNHEQMMIEAFSSCKNPCKPTGDEIYNFFSLWFSNGGSSTFEEFENEEDSSKTYLLEKIKKLPAYKIIEKENEKYLLIHAGIYYETFDDKSLEEMLELNIEKQLYLWIREDFLDVKAPNEKNPLYNFKIFHGHTPTLFLPNYMGYLIPPLTKEETNLCLKGNIFEKNNKINLDCGCAYQETNKNAKLGCYCLETKELFYT